MNFQKFAGAAVIAAAACTLSGGAAQAAAPKQLYNRTVKASWTVNLVTKAPDGRVHNVAMSVNGIVYVSSAGRLFVAGTRSVGRVGSETKMAGPGQNYGATKSNVSFQGNRIIGSFSSAQGGGAVQVVMTFDPSYANCNVNVVYGRSGKGKASYEGVNEKGVMYEMQSYSIANQSCSIVDGNPFAAGS
ncbi:MAG: hypothetical protein A4S14_05650 [Proteobacteria bacterium SG_bin9]|nr:MAG: hypothetical protein A4S14_05650 [Proteobacteria bacterium SG_bin9]